MKTGDLTRDRLLAIIRERGGIHKSEIKRLTKHGWGNVSYHLDKLEEARLIEIEPHGRLAWAFMSDLRPSQRLAIVAKRPTAARRMLEALGLKSHSTINSLSEECALSRKVIRNHLGNLERSGVVNKVPGRPPRFEVARK